MNAITDNIRAAMDTAREKLRATIGSETDKVTAKRDEIATLKAEQQRITSAPVTKAEALQRLDRLIEAAADHCALETFAGPLLGPREPDDLFAKPVEVLNTRLQEDPAARAFRLVCAFVPERVKKQLAAEIDAHADDKAAIATRDRATMLGKVAEQLSSCEVEEELMISSLEEMDVAIDRRPDLSPAAFFLAHGAGAIDRLGAMITAAGQLHAAMVDLGERRRAALDDRTMVLARIASARSIPSRSLRHQQFPSGAGASVQVVETDHEARRRFEQQPLSQDEQSSLARATEAHQQIEAEYADLTRRWHAKNVVAKALEAYAVDKFLEAKDRLKRYHRSPFPPAIAGGDYLREKLFNEGQAVARQAFGGPAA